MSDKKQKVGWVYNLRKDQAIEELKNRNISYDDELNLDQLRRLLVENIKAGELKPEVNGKKSQTAQETGKSESTEQNPERDATTVQSENLAENSGTGSSSNTEENSDTESDMASDTPKLEFCLNKHDWEIFADRLEIYFTAKGIAEEKQASTARTKFDESAYKLLKSL